MQIEKIIYREDEIIFKLKEGNNKYAMKLNRIKDLPDRETVDKWCKYINKNFDGNEEEKLDEEVLFLFLGLFDRSIQLFEFIFKYF